MPRSATPKETTQPKRKCRYCKAFFVPERSTQHFCQPNHRKDFWRYGGLPYEKLFARVEKETRRIVQEEMTALVERITALEARRR